MNTENWKTNLGAIINNDVYPGDTEVEDHAQNWFCCAVGAKIAKDLGLADDIDPYQASGVSDELTEYLKPHVENLGSDFFASIAAGHYETARELFDEIQAMPIEDVVDLSCKKNIQELYDYAKRTEPFHSKYSTVPN